MGCCYCRSTAGSAPPDSVYSSWRLRFTSDNPPSWLTVTLVICCVLGPLHLLVMPQWRYRVHRWEVTGEAGYTQSGWLKQEWRSAPISRIRCCASDTAV